MRPTEPEGSIAAVKRFLRNWHGSGVKGDFLHSVANVPVELLRDMRVPWPKMLGKLMLVLQVYGASIAVLTLAALVAWLYLVMV